MSNTPLTRAFIAISFPDPIIKEIARIQEVVQNNQPFTGKYTELENIHLTLKFLGEIPQEKIESVKKQLAQIKYDSSDAYLEYAGTFSRFGAPKIVWIKIGGSGLLALQKQIDESLKDLFPKEERFMSHITIARIKYLKNKQGFVEYIKHCAVQRISFPITSFQLKSSELRPLGPVYTTMAEYPSISNAEVIP